MHSWQYLSTFHWLCLAVNECLILLPPTTPFLVSLLFWKTPPGTSQYPPTCEQTKNIHSSPQNTQHTRLHVHVSKQELFLCVWGPTILHVPDLVRHCSFWWLSDVLMCLTICAGKNTVCSACCINVSPCYLQQHDMPLAQANGEKPLISFVHRNVTCSVFN